MNNPELIKIAGVENAKGVWSPPSRCPATWTTPRPSKFIADYKAKYGSRTEQRVDGDGRGRLPRDQVRHRADQVHRPEDAGGVPAQGLQDYPGITGPILGFDEKGDRHGTIHKAYVINDQGQFVPYKK